MFNINHIGDFIGLERCQGLLFVYSLSGSQWAIWAEEGDIWCLGDIITAILVVIILEGKIPELTMLFSFLKSELRYIFFSRLTSIKNTSVTRKC